MLKVGLITYPLTFKRPNYRNSIPAVRQCDVTGSDFCTKYILLYRCQFECVKLKILKSGFSLSASMDFIKLNFVNSLVEFLLAL